MANVTIGGLVALGAAPADEDLLEIEDDPSGSPVSKKITVAELRASMQPSRAIFADEKAAGTDGGGSSAATWNIRDINTTRLNEIAGCSLAANVVTLAAGTYEIEAWAIAHDSDGHQLRWYNIDDAGPECVGTSSFVNDSDGSASLAYLLDEFTIAAQKDFRLEHYTEVAKASTGLGIGFNSGEVSVYAFVKLTLKPEA